MRDKADQVLFSVDDRKMPERPALERLAMQWMDQRRDRASTGGPPHVRRTITSHHPWKLGVSTNSPCS
jgi:hypothetical protein